MPAVLQTPLKKSLYPAGILAVNFDAIQYAHHSTTIISGEFQLPPKKQHLSKNKTMKNIGWATAGVTGPALLNHTHSTNVVKGRGVQLLAVA